jgi:hypothetical protein
MGKEIEKNDAKMQNVEKNKLGQNEKYSEQQE